MWAASHPRRLPGRGQRRWHARCTWCARAAVSGRVRRARAPRARAPLCAPVVRSFVEVDFGVYGEPVWLEIDDAAVPIAHGGCSGHVRDACGSLGAILRQKQVGKKCFGFRPASAATHLSSNARIALTRISRGCPRLRAPLGRVPAPRSPAVVSRVGRRPSHATKRTRGVSRGAPHAAVASDGRDAPGGSSASGGEEPPAQAGRGPGCADSSRGPPSGTGSS